MAMLGMDGHGPYFDWGGGIDMAGSCSVGTVRLCTFHICAAIHAAQMTQVVAQFCGLHGYTCTYIVSYMLSVPIIHTTRRCMTAIHRCWTSAAPETSHLAGYDVCSPFILTLCAVTV